MTRRVRSTDTAAIQLPDGWHHQFTPFPDTFILTHNGIPVGEVMFYGDPHPSQRMTDICHGLNIGAPEA
jgi:hypothetical protein